MRKQFAVLGFIGLFVLTGCAAGQGGGASQETPSATVEAATPSPMPVSEVDTGMCAGVEVIMGPILDAQDEPSDEARVAIAEESAKSFELLAVSASGRMADALVRASEAASDWALLGAPIEGYGVNSLFVAVSELYDMCIANAGEPNPTPTRETDAVLCEGASLAMSVVYGAYEGTDDDAERVATAEEGARTLGLLAERAQGKMADALITARDGIAEWAFQGAPVEGRHATDFMLSLSDLLELC